MSNKKLNESYLSSERPSAVASERPSADGATAMSLEPFVDALSVEDMAAWRQLPNNIILHQTIPTYDTVVAIIISASNLSTVAIIICASNFSNGESIENASLEWEIIKNIIKNISG
ncbi:hypothetical protein AMTR_s00012p00263080 [Amborella trichopoda]|uniref:Uncharacterized protein n=1 Tax=Amborella trichopoda TaxID=13333 RepID=W1PK66_AMBTC|nr:hypothetical protein AMTR_s00012p00263080 [Amborella trichopoda]